MKWIAASTCERSMYCPRPLRRRSSSAAPMVARPIRGLIKSVNAAHGPSGGRSGHQRQGKEGGYDRAHKDSGGYPVKI